MAATVTLSTTTLATTVEPGDSLLTLGSLSSVPLNLLVPTRLYVDRELMAVEQITGIGNQVVVRRGTGGTAASRHATNTTVYIGRADQFYTSDPIGLPPVSVQVSPWINVVTGVAWVAQGDEAGPGNAGRIWAPITVTEAAGALGVTVITTTTPT